MDKFIKEITSFKKLFDRELNKYLVQKQEEAKKVSGEYSGLVKILADYVLAGGKRIRPFLVYQGCGVCGGQNKKQAIKVGMAVEIFHAFALIHDDIMDGADLRRNQLTLHKQLTKWHQAKRWKGASTNFGTGMAILAGDILFTWADELIVNLKNNQVLQVYQDMKKELMAGQAEDIFLSIVNGSPSQKRIVQTMLRKSAGYSIEKPLFLGAALARAGDKYYRFFRQVSMPLGLAFQLKDDILGMFGKRQEVGKPTDSDIKEGKMTLLIFHALREGYLPKKIYSQVLGNQGVTVKQVREFKKLLKNSGVLDKINAEVTSYITKARKVIKRSPSIKQESKDIFLGLAMFLQNRKY